ncbi:unnamed protein product [Paramecium primaurelia]|uniref:Uncharacterized protein n=1 Tax=Paramecium primaurelia TaxID=5886 RepID=A0A8S1QNQ4_PARPR|nr:unnamed protein product [Paramecium primaurelia]
MREQILNFVFSKGFVRRRNLWYVAFITPFILFLTEIESQKVELIAQLAWRKRFAYSQFNSTQLDCSKEEFSIIDHKIKMNNPK